MIRIIFYIFLSLSPGMLHAETIVVRSGEHADFSRIVLQLSSPVEWVFGRVDGGYELRSDAYDTVFDTSTVFDLIPKTRILAVSSPGPGRLFVSVSCNCAGDAFEIRNGRIVLDIKDGQPDEVSRFETVMPTLATGSGWQRNTKVSAAEYDSQLWSVTGAGLSPIEPSAQIPDSLDVQLGRPRVNAIPNAEANRPPVSTMPLQPSVAEPFRNRGVPGSDRVENDTIAISQVADDQYAPLLPTWPRDFLDPIKSEFLSPPGRLALAKQELLLQFGRAASQGVLNIEHPEISILPQLITPLPQAPSGQLPKEPLNTNDDSSSIGAHLRIESVYDRDEILTTQIPALTNTGQSCLEQELFEISEWGPQNLLAAPFDDLRTKVVLEFDEADPKAITDLTRRYLYLGFGAEAKALVSAFNVPIPDADILMQIAEIVDNGIATNPSRLLSQLNCTTDASMWGILAAQTIPVGELVDSRPVLRTFSGLPPHLRERIGPWLAERFLESNDLQTATTIRNAIERAIGERGPGFQLMQARLAAAEKDSEGAILLFEQVAMSGGAAAPDAIVELIEGRLALGLEIDPKTAALADTLSVESRDTDMGRKLSYVTIRALVGSEQIEFAFERIETAIRNGLINSAEAEMLSNEAHLMNALNASDTEFLMTVFQNGNSLGYDSDQARTALRKTASRLLSLGMQAKVIQLYSIAGFEKGIPDHQIIAGAYLALGDPISAIGQLDGLKDKESRLLVARAKEMQLDFPAAAQIYETLEMSGEYNSLAWRAGNWQAVLRGESEIRAQVAELVLAELPVLMPDQPEIQDPELSGSEEQLNSVKISESKELLINSSATRQLIESLLNTN